jgi:ribosome-associated translation inhibitor RaiA
MQFSVRTMQHQPLHFLSARRSIMQVQIATRKIPLTPSFRQFILDQVLAVMEKFAAKIHSIQVELRDKNGRRGGGDKRVRIRVTLAPDAPPVVVEEECASIRLAIRHAVARAGSSVRSLLRSRPS